MPEAPLITCSMPRGRAFFPFFALVVVFTFAAARTFYLSTGLRLRARALLRCFLFLAECCELSASYGFRAGGRLTFTTFGGAASDICLNHAACAGITGDTTMAGRRIAALGLQPGPLPARAVAKFTGLKLAAVNRAHSPYFERVRQGTSGEHDFFFIIWGVPEEGQDVSSTKQWIADGGVSIAAYLELGSAVNLHGVVTQLRAVAVDHVDDSARERATRALERSDVYSKATLDTYSLLELAVDDCTPKSFSIALLEAYDSGVFMSPVCGWVDPEVEGGTSASGDGGDGGGGSAACSSHCSSHEPNGTSSSVSAAMLTYALQLMFAFLSLLPQVRGTTAVEMVGSCMTRAMVLASPPPLLLVQTPYNTVRSLTLSEAATPAMSSSPWSVMQATTG